MESFRRRKEEEAKEKLETVVRKKLNFDFL